MFSKILLATDGSEGALKAASVTAEIARQFGAEVIVLHVYTPISQLVPAYALAGVDPDMDIGKVQDAVLGGTCRGLDWPGIGYVTRREIGSPAEHIVSMAEREQADLIIVGSRGLGGVKSLFLGSVSDRVTHHAHCPVLIVR